MGVIYCITFKNNKRYIGQTIRILEKRIDEHIKDPSCIALHSAIKKYGTDSFTVETLLIINDEFLDYYEKEFIILFDTLVPNGYNIRTGGSNGKHCEESRERMRISKLGSKNHNFGKPRTEETRLKISEKKKGENHHFYGKELSIEHRTKLSQSYKVYDKNLPMYIAYLQERPKHYQAAGYVVIYPKTPKKFFTSKKFTLEEKLDLAKTYLNELIEKFADTNIKKDT